MSSVSGSDSYNYYQKQLNDYSDEISAERKKAKERENERISDLERRHARDLRESDEAHERALVKANKASNETLASERETAKQDYAQLKKDTYDRYGRLYQDSDHETHQQIEELQHNYALQKNRHDGELHQAEETFNARLAHRDQVADLEMEKGIQQTRDGLFEANHSAIQSERDHAASRAAEAALRYRELDKTRLEDMELQRRRYEGAFDQQKLDLERRIELAKNAYEKSAARQEKVLRETQSNDTSRLRASHEQETRELREKMSDLVNAEKNYVKDSAQAKSEVVHGYEDEWRNRLDVTQANAKAEIEDLKNQSARTEHYMARRNDENLADRDAYFARIIQQQNAKSHQTERSLMDTFVKDRQETEASHRQDREMQTRTFETRMDKAARASDDALRNQAQTLERNTENQRKLDQIQIDRLQDSLRERQTSSDTSLISPAAEASLRRQISDQYEKVAQADQDRRLRENNQLRDEYQHTFKEQQQVNTLKETQLNRTLAAQQNDDRMRFNAHVADLEYMKDSSLRSMQTDNNRERENMSKNYSRTLERQTRESDEAVNATRDQANSRINAIREENEFNAKMAQREFSNKINETVHDYERKMNDQKLDYEGRLEDMRAQTSAQAREADRRFKGQLDEQARGYEQKLSQQEAQHKERERYMAQTYQDELEKTRRSNQMLTNKRG